MYRDLNLMEHFLSFLPSMTLNDIAQQSAEETANNPNIAVARRFIRFMEEMPGGFFIYRADSDEEIIFANNALLRIFRCDTMAEFMELTHGSFKGLVHPDDLEAVEQSITEQIADSQYDLDYVEYRIIRKDGQIRWLEDYGHFTHTENAGDFFYVFVGDATEKRQRQLQETANLLLEKQKNEEQLKTLMEERNAAHTLIHQENLRRLEVIEGLSMSYESILYADLDKDHILPYRLSYRTARQFKNKFETRSYDWFIKNYIESWVHPEEQDMVAAATSPEYLRLRLAESKRYSVNFRIVNGSDIQYLQLQIVNVGDSENVSQVVFGFRRVDEELQREQVQKQLLEDALREAKLSIVAKNTFLSNMSHDMRTPLNAISGFTTLAKTQCSPENPVYGYLEKIETAGKQLLDLINKVLETAWAESNDIQLSETEFDLNTVIQEVYSLLLPKAQQKNIRLELNVSLDHPQVYSAPDRISQIIHHLVSNAIIYTDADGKVELNVTELPAVQGTPRYQFVVTDNGIGISPEFLAHIYDPFEREKNTTHSGIHGSGLGLTITKSIVEKLDGSIEAYSTVGRGSSFTVILPMEIRESADDAQDSTADAFARLLDQHILLVEDNELNCEIETALLQQLGLRIETAENGKLALDKITHSPPGTYGLILMDIQMPVMDGWEAARAIRALDNPELASIPIIALSANAFESDKHSSMECGINAHLAKPFDIPLLLKTIGQIL